VGIGQEGVGIILHHHQTKGIVAGGLYNSAVPVTTARNRLAAWLAKNVAQMVLQVVLEKLYPCFVF
jgi:hypothetical protein